MKKILYIATIALGVTMTTSSCKTDFDTDVDSVNITNGSADFSKFVALGNSLTSGYRDNALYADGQIESIPNIIAQQMKLAGGGDFKQPLVNNNIGGFSALNINGKLTLQLVNGSLLPVPSPAGQVAPDPIFADGPYQNLGVPGAKSFHLLLDNYGGLNPYYARFSNGKSLLKEAISQSPTFFSLWIGNNDVLAYATSGGSGVDQTGNSNLASYGTNDITDPTLFTSTLGAIVNQLTSNGAKGVIANIPNVTSIPFFTRVPSKPFTALSQAQITQLNTAYQTYNGGLLQAKNAGAITEEEYQARIITFSTNTPNGAVIIDEDLTNLSALGIPSLRQTTNKDLILLTASSVLSTGGGTATPLADSLVLTESEVAKISVATTAYNTAIKNIADAKGIAFVDANAKLAELNQNSGILYNGVKYTTTFVTGGAFSLDGVHLTGKGYAIVANEFIKAINTKYNSTLPQVNVNKYSGVKFP